MNQNICALCDNEITDKNDTREHIIPNSIGGRKKVKKFICISCNKKTGETWDSELAKQIHQLSLYLGTKRERGEVPSQIFETRDGKKITLNADASMTIDKPIVHKEEKNGIIEFSIKARNTQEAKQILRGLKKGIPTIDIENELSNASFISTYTSSPINIKPGNLLNNIFCRMSIIKTTLALAKYADIPISLCDLALKNLKSSNSNDCLSYYYKNDIVRDRPLGIPIHCVAIKACPISRKIIGYIEYFGIYRIIIQLSHSYSGTELEAQYSIDPTSGKELSLQIDFNIYTEESPEDFDSRPMENPTLNKALSSVIGYRQNLLNAQEQERVIEKAVKLAFENCGANQNEDLTSEQINLLYKNLVKELEPYLIHLASLNP